MVQPQFLQMIGNVSTDHSIPNLPKKYELKLVSLWQGYVGKGEDPKINIAEWLLD